MLFKRHFGEVENDGSEVPGHEFRKRPTFAGTVRDVMNRLSVHEFALKLEPFFRRVVREEVERTLLSSLRLSPNQVIPESAGGRSLQLHFVNKLPSTLFTNTRVESEDCEQVKVVLLDATSNYRITSGPLSSMKIEMLVLDGDFLADDWSEKELHAKIVREREGKRPLLTGDLVVTLRDGVGYIGDISFTDNSSWIRSRRFRLGARMQNTSSDVKIREAISEAFVVKDHRGESYKKHHPPHMGDEVWRLERIAKDGACHKRLASHGISSVKDFLHWYYMDPSLLRNVLGGGISNKTWETIVDHATCVTDDGKCYMYYRAEERVGLLLNSVFKVVGATFNGQNYQSLDCLSIYQKQLVEELKWHAYQNLNALVPVDNLPFVGNQMLLSDEQQSDPLNNPCLGLQNVSFPAKQGWVQIS